MCYAKYTIVFMCLSTLACILSAPVMKRVAIIGGGASGYFSSIECANILKSSRDCPYEVVIFEAGKRPLSKVLISGGGRCNVMHDPRKAVPEISKVSLVVFYLSPNIHCYCCRDILEDIRSC